MKAKAITKRLMNQKVGIQDVTEFGLCLKPIEEKKIDTISARIIITGYKKFSFRLRFYLMVMKVIQIFIPLKLEMKAEME